MKPLMILVLSMFLAACGVNYNFPHKEVVNPSSAPFAPAK